MFDAFILNPVAGNGFSVQTMEKIETTLREKKREYRVFRTERPMHASEIAEELGRNDEVRAVASVGGDGTAFETANGLQGTGKPMGIIPAGTGNDFIKSIGIPKDPMKALERFLYGDIVPIDMGKLNTGNFLNVCGTGFDVTVLDYAESLKKKYRGLTPYFLGLLKAIFHYQPVHLILTADGKTEEGDYLICSVANGQYIGGGIPICPEADPGDGKLDLVLVRNVHRGRIPFYLPGLMTGKILQFGITRHQRVSQASIRGKGLRVNVDGEIFSMDQADFSILEKKLLVIR